MADEVYGNAVLPENWTDWVVVGELGRNPFSVVYEAERKDDPSVRCAVRLMMIPRDESEYDDLIADGFSTEQIQSFFDQAVDDFIREIRRMEQFRGIPGIVSVEDYQIVPGITGIGSRVFIRTELLTPLEKYISDKVLSEEEMIRIGTEICTALFCTHEQGIVHRDIKPANIFVNDHLGTHVFYKLGDFGIARSLEGKTQGISSGGFPGFLAPEAVTGMEYSPASDLYSLGLTLYWLANNKRLPFFPQTQLYTPSARQDALQRRLAGEALEPPVNASAGLSRVILKACSFRPEDRYRSAEEMKAALEELNRKESSGSSPESYEGPAQERHRSAKRKILYPAVLLLVCSCMFAAFLLFPKHPVTEPADDAVTETPGQESALDTFGQDTSEETPGQETVTGTPVQTKQTDPDLMAIDRDALNLGFSHLVDQLVPIHAVRESAGIRMEIIGAVVTETQSMIVFSMQDLEGSRINEHSFFHLDDDIGEHITQVETDLTGNMSDPDGNRIVKVLQTEHESVDLTEDRDITFIMNDLADSTLTKVDLGPYIREYAQKVDGIDPPESSGWKPVKILDPAQSLNIPLCQDVTLTGIGWIGDQLHIQFHIVNNGLSDFGSGHHMCPVDFSVYEWDTDQGGKYTGPVGRGYYSWGDENGDGYDNWEEYTYDCGRERIDQLMITATIQENHELIDASWVVSIPLSRIRGR